MKKILFVLVFVTMAVASQAQLFVGGYLGFNRTGGNSEITTYFDQGATSGTSSAYA